MAGDYRCAQAGAQEARENVRGDKRRATVVLWHQLRLRFVEYLRRGGILELDLMDIWCDMKWSPAKD
jgi:hypothetical protein